MVSFIFIKIKKKLFIAKTFSDNVQTNNELTFYKLFVF